MRNVKWLLVVVLTIGFLFFLNINRAVGEEPSGVATTTVAPVSVVTTPPVPFYSAPKLKKGMSKDAAKKRVTRDRPFKIKYKRLNSWKYRKGEVIKWKVTPASPTTSTAGRYSKGTVVTVWYGKKPPRPKHKDNRKYGVEKWRPLVRWHLKNRKCWSQRIENNMLKYCIRPESGGRAITDGGSGSSDGLCQYLSSWKIADDKYCCKSKRGNYRECGEWAIWRMVRGYDLRGESFLRSTWVNYP